MGIFRDITKKLKKAAPLIGSAIGMYFGGPLGASIGSGIGSLASGRSAEEALRNAALTGATTYAMGGKDFGKGFKFDTSGSPFASVGSGVSAEAPVSAVKETGIGTIFDKIIPESTMGKIALGSTALGLLGLGDEEVPQDKPIRDYPVGKTRLGYGRIGNKLYNLDDEEERKQYFEDNRKRQGAEDLAAGGEVTGPGTGTSDSVPARLSDGEFVVTAKAVRGAGGGDRNIGAARMYDMMSQLEGAA
jgi:hypothetical protein|tara:strand:- start:1025 stop:1762 length:738 start_codon:yes stop_codon:yes gene_type:complete